MRDAVVVARRIRLGSVAVGLAAAITLQGCGAAPAGGAAHIPSALRQEARPIGVGPAFRPPVSGSVLAPCRRSLGDRDGVHVEVFAANRVVLIPAGVGTRPPRSVLDARVTKARCYGRLVTLDPTGLVLVRPGSDLTLSTLFRAWGEPLSSRQVASFRAGRGASVSVYVDGQPWSGSPRTVPLVAHAEIVVEVGPFVPPHSSYTFPAGT